VAALSAVTTFLIVFAIRALPGHPPPAPAAPKADRTVPSRIVPVQTIRVLPPEPVRAASVDPKPEAALPSAVPDEPLVEEQPRKSSRRRVTTGDRARGDGFCGRYGLRKEITRGGKSWRCRR
jgi:hypothetical protein